MSTSAVALLAVGPLGAVASLASDGTPSGGAPADSAPADGGADAPTPGPGAAGVLDGVLGEDLVSAQGAAHDPAAASAATYPGLPPPTGNQYDGVGASGITEVVGSRQYLRIPSVAMAADVGVTIVKPTPPGFISAIDTSLGAYVVSPPGAAHPYGDFPPFRALLLAFGALPVEATVQISQLRDAQDLPVPIKGAQRSSFSPSFFQRQDDASLTGRVNVSVSDLTLDGVPVGLGSSCTTVAPATLDLVGTGFWTSGTEYWTLDSPVPTPATLLTPQQVKDEHYVVTDGGLLSGTIDVPAFAGCTSPGGDLSALVTSAVSGSGQPLMVRQSTTFTCFPPELVTDCQIPDPFPYPVPAG